MREDVLDLLEEELRPEVDRLQFLQDAGGVQIVRRGPNTPEYLRQYYFENRTWLLFYRRRWGRANPDRERAYGQRKHSARRKDPRRWATWLARQERHRPTKLKRAKERYRANLEASRARARANSARWYAKHAKRLREGKRKCTLCRQPGHNRIRCGRQ